MIYHCLWYIQGDTVDSEHLSELTEEEYEVNFVKPHLKGFLKFDVKYLIPFLTRRFTKQVCLLVLIAI
jgi:solute carrier family 9 (sodium/hydrogen exchanger), member 8